MNIFNNNHSVDTEKSNGSWISHNYEYIRFYSLATYNITTYLSLKCLLVYTEDASACSVKIFREVDILRSWKKPAFELRCIICSGCSRMSFKGKIHFLATLGLKLLIKIGR